MASFQITTLVTGYIVYRDEVPMAAGVVLGLRIGYIIFKSYHDVNTIFYGRFKNLDLWAAVAFATFFFFVSSLILKEKTEASTKWFFC